MLAPLAGRVLADRRASPPAVSNVLQSPLPTPAPTPTPAPPGPPAAQPRESVPVWVDVGPSFSLAEPGEVITFTLVAGVSQQHVVPEAEVRATLPGGLSYVPREDDGCVYDSQSRTLACSLDALQAGESRSFSIRARVEDGGADLIFGTFEAYSAGQPTGLFLVATVQVEHSPVQVVAPAEQPLLRSPGQRVAVDFAATAGSGAMTLRYRPTGLPAPLRYVRGPVFELSAMDAVGRAMRRTGRPFRIEVSYAGLPNLGNDASRRLLALFLYDEESGQWTRLVTHHTDDEMAAQSLTTAASGGEAMEPEATSTAAEETVWATTDELGVVALATSTQNNLGDYAQPWSPTVPDFQVDLFTGAASWRLPVDAPAGRGGLTPRLGFSYNSGIVDELHGKVNPQTPGVGLGWSFATAYVEREIERDAVGTPKVYLEGGDTFRLVLNGVSSELVCIDSSVTPCVEYRAEDERFWRVRKLTGAPNESQYSGQSALKGEYWLVTATDGTTYRFGWSGDPARYNFDDNNEGEQSAWYMFGKEVPGGVIVPYMWRWNLDRIEDTQGNVASFFYNREYNDYNVCNGNDPYADCWYGVDGLNEYWNGPEYFWAFTPDGVLHYVYNSGLNGWEYGYVRGGSLAWVSYTRGGGGSDPYNVSLETREETDHYPDGFDSYQGEDGRWVQDVQTFWSKNVISSVDVKSEYGLLRRYALVNVFAEGRLILERVQVMGSDGVAALPDIEFTYHRLAGSCNELNADGFCVDADHEADHKHWLNTVYNGYGGSVNYNYTAPLDGFPYFQNGQILQPDTDSDGAYWYRYRAREVITDPGTGPENKMRTVYEYRQADPLDLSPHNGTWQEDEFRGHPRVRVIEREGGSGATAYSYSDHYFYQGDGGTTTDVCGRSVQDQDGMEGREYKVVRNDGGGNPLAQTVTAHQFTDYGGGRHFVGVAAICQYPAGPEGPLSKTSYQYDDYGNVTGQYRQGNVDLGGDETYVSRYFVPNEGAWIVGLPSVEHISAGTWGRALQETRYSYDGQEWGSPPISGTLTQVAVGGGDLWATTSYQYDQFGNPTAVTGPLGHTTRTGYDSPYHLYPISVTNPLTQTVLTQWDLALAVPVTTTDANGAVTRYQYDQFARLVSVTGPDPETGAPGSEPDVVYTYPTPVGGQVAAPFAIGTASRTGPATYHQSWTLYDGLGRPLQAQEEAGGGALALTSTGYDARGLVVRESLPINVTGAGGVYAPPDWNLLYAATTEYDALGRPELVTAPDGEQTARAYAGWQSLVLDPLGHQVISKQDGQGRLVAVRECTGAWGTPTWEAPGAETRYWYEARGLLTAVQDGEGNVARMGYDALGRKVEMQDPSMGHWEYGYDLAGNLTAQTDACGVTLLFDYDRLDRLERKEVAGGPVLAEYGYDGGAWAIGRRTAMTDTTGVTTWAYDARGRPVTETRVLADGLGAYVTGWGYDEAGRVAQLRYPTGEVVETSFDTRGLVESVTGQLDGSAWHYLTGASYDAAGQVTLQLWGNGRATSYDYRPDSLRLERLQVTGGLLDLHYAYDPVGNVKGITDTVPAETTTFGYDERDRLVSAAGPYNEGYDYSAMGNVLTRTVEGQARAYTYGETTVISPSVPPGMQPRMYLPLVMGGQASYPAVPYPTTGQPFAALALSDGSQFAYDENGNMTLRVVVSGTETTTYTQGFDPENRLAVVTDTVSGVVTCFAYDGGGARIWQTDGATTTVTLGDLVEVETGPAGWVERTYYYAAGRRIAMRVNDGVNSGVYYLHTDHLGSTTLATNESGAAAGEQRYRPFGEARGGSAMPTEYGFTGQRLETGIGLHD